MTRAKRHIGIVTGGGDCPGLNAVIRSVTKSAIQDYGFQVIGFEDGYYGLIEDRAIPLDWDTVSGILNMGGTILGTSNKADPFAYARKLPDGHVVRTNETEAVKRTYEKHHLEGLVVVGGDGSMTIAHGLSKLGLNIVGIPKTIDNDLFGTDQSFGFDTAVGVITDAIDRIRTTAMSHHRAMVIETMGRNAGWLALTAGVAGGAEIILLPEIEYDIDCVCREVERRSRQGRRYSLIVVAEGARQKGGQQVVERRLADSPEPIRLGGIGRQVADQVETRTGIEARVTVLGHLQRGGTPSPFDRMLGTLYGHKAVELVSHGRFGRMASLEHMRVESVEIEVAAGRQRKVPVDHPLIHAARSLGTVFGDTF